MTLSSAPTAARLQPLRLCPQRLPNKSAPMGTSSRAVHYTAGLRACPEHASAALHRTPYGYTTARPYTSPSGVSSAYPSARCCTSVLLGEVRTAVARSEGGVDSSPPALPATAVTCGWAQGTC